MGVFSIWHWIIVLFIIIIVVASLWIFIWKKNKNLINKYDEKSRLKRGSYAIRGIPTVFLINVFGNLMGQGQVALPIGIIGLIIALIYYINITIKRFHDMNMSGWYTLLTVIPFVSLILFFVRGTARELDISDEIKEDI